MKTTIKYTSIVSLAISTFYANATASNIEFSGFASFVIGQTLDSDEIFIGDAVGGGIYDDKLSLKPESIMAIQAHQALDNRFSYTAQLVSRGSQSYDTEFEQAFITYKHDANWTFYAGRRGLTLYQYSDYLEVGYAYNYMRPPLTMYFSPINTYDGLSLSYKNTVSEFPFHVDAYYGSAEGKAIYTSQVTGADVYVDAPKTYGISTSFFGEYWDIKVGRHYSEINLNIADNNLFPEGMYANYTSGSFNYERNNVLFTFEAADYFDDGHFNDLITYFVSVGYRFGDFIPTLGYSKYDETATSAPEGINSFRGPEIDYEITSATLRYDVHSNAALKLDLSRYKDLKAPLYGDATLISAGIDLVF